jgi:hypothetical protein
MVDVNVTYPPAGYTIEREEEDYFVAYGTTDAPMISSMIDGVSGVVHTDSVTGGLFWWAEFTGLKTMPGPGKGYKFYGVNSENDMSEPIVIDIAKN